MRIYTLTIAVEESEPEPKVDTDPKEVAKLLREVAHDVSTIGLPSPSGGQLVLRSARARAFLTSARMPDRDRVL